MHCITLLEPCLDDHMAVWHSRATAHHDGDDMLRPHLDAQFTLLH
jgi:hypothetical protein